MNEFDDHFDESWIVRDFEEFDEKLPLIVNIIFDEELDYRELEDEGDDSGEAVTEIYKIMQNTLTCLVEMTFDEIDYYMDMIIVGCEIKELILQGVLSEEDGKIRLETGDS